MALERLSLNISCMTGFVDTGKWKEKWYKTIWVHRTLSSIDLISITSLITKMLWQEQTDYMKIGSSLSDTKKRLNQTSTNKRCCKIIAVKNLLAFLE